MGRMNGATVKWLRVDDYEGWVLQFQDDHGMPEARRMKGSRDASRDELVAHVTDAMRGEYLDGKITVYRDGRPAEAITAARGLAS